MSSHCEKLLPLSPTWSGVPSQVEPPPTSFSLSVLVPVYNERHLVETSLRRLLALKDELVRSLEVIVVDDCSTDGSWEILQRVAREDSRVVLSRHKSNRGKGAALRTAVVVRKVTGSEHGIGVFGGKRS